MKVLRIPVKSLHNEEWFNMNIDLKKEVLRYGATTIGIGDLFNTYQPLYSKADKLLQVLQKSVYTLDMEAADKKRDDLFKGFFGVVKNSRKQPDAAKSRAALVVYNVLKEYQNSVLRGSYSEESSALYNLLQDLRGQYAADVATLGFTDWVLALKQAEADFLSVRGERQDESFAKPKEKFRHVRSEIDGLYTAMLHVLDARLLAAGLGGDTVVEPESLDTSVHEDGDPFKPERDGNITYNFVVNWNEILKRYRDLIQQRAGRRAKEKDEGADEFPIED
jgi:hypothetical protein